MRTKTTEIVTTPELKQGDIVQAHGSLFRLQERNTDDKATRHPDVLECIWFRTDYLGPVTWPNGNTAQEQIPAHWRTVDRPWVIQGNSRARWMRVTLD